MDRSKLKVAVVGPGAVGGIAAAWLAQSTALAVSVAVRTPFDRLVVETPEAVIHARPTMLTDPAQAGIADWVLIATKAYDAAATKAWLARLVGPATRVAVLQNGVEHVARFADVVPAERLVPVVVDIPAERLAPGHLRQRANGTMIVPAGRDGRAFVGLFAHSPIHASVTDDFVTAAWTKLASNCTGVVNALTGQPAGIAARDDVAELIRALVRECILVGRAEGAVLDDALPDSIVTRYRTGRPDAVNSLHADFAAGRPIELDARNGVIVRLGRKHAIPTPMHALMITLLEAASTPDR